MGFFPWVVTVLGVAFAVLAAKEKELSITYLCFFVALGLLALVLDLQNKFASYVSGGSSSRALQPSEIRGLAVEVNDSLFALHKPPETLPSVQVVLFHGLHDGNYSDAYLSTWLSSDGSCLWPKTWLAEEIAGVHVYSVCYSRGDMHIIGENLVTDLLDGEIGQASYCPVILVGHSIGGLVIKKICKQAHDKLHIKRGPEKDKYEAFLRNIKGIFFYSTPHRGSRIAKKLRKRIPWPLLKYIETLSTDTTRLNDDFEQICKVRDGWVIAGVSEGLPTSLGPLRYFWKDFVVEEAAARFGDFNVVDGADHFSICRPRNKTSRSFHKLQKFVLQIAKDMQDAMLQEEARPLEVRLQEEARALENSIPANFQDVPENAIRLDSQVQEIIGRLDKSRTVGLVGMGGLGKTTLAMEIFNRLAPDFEYTCFFAKVKECNGNEENLIDEIGRKMHRYGKKLEEKEVEEAEWKRKKLLLVLDDISGERDENVLLKLARPMSVEKRIIFTSRKQPFEPLGEIYKVDSLNDGCGRELFLSCAVVKPKIFSPEWNHLINGIVRKCEGLPLALVVLGKSLRRKTKIIEWEQTLSALKKAEGLESVDDRLWAKLRESYDGLEERPQQIFLDAVTFFSVRNWKLLEAKAAWREAYGSSESLLWGMLVERSLVYDVQDSECVRVHEQLENMGRMIALEFIRNGRRVDWDEDGGMKLLQNTKEIHAEEIFALRLGRPDGDEEMHIASTFHPGLKALRNLEINDQVVVDGPQECLPFQKGLVLLECRAPEIPEVLLRPAHRATLVILRLKWTESCLTFRSFSKVRFLTLSLYSYMKTLPDEIGNLSNLEVLKLLYCSSLQTLPESFGYLCSLNHLEILDSNELQTLPVSFGRLSALTHLTLVCHKLQTLPVSFGRLSALTHLKLVCHKLQTLPVSIGNLSALTHLELVCHELQTLPKSFGGLSALAHLELVCHELQILPKSFGGLSALTHLELVCLQLQTLPESFGGLSALTHLELVCHQLQTLPKSFGILSALAHLELVCYKLHTLPRSFGDLSALTHLELVCHQLQTLPKSFGILCALTHLELVCHQLPTLPESFGNLSALSHLKFDRCHKLVTLPMSFRCLSSLNYLEFEDCDKLKALPESLRGALTIDPANIIFRGETRVQKDHTEEDDTGPF